MSNLQYKNGMLSFYNIISVQIIGHI